MEFERGIRISTIRNPQSTAALLTPRGRGAVATIRFEGDCRLIDDADPAIFRAANGKPLADQPINRVVFGKWGTGAPEDVVVCRTAAQAVEIHCHGGETAAQRLLDDLQSIGCKIESWQAFSTRSAGLFETECLEALTQATTLRTAEILLQQQSGVLRELISTNWTPAERKEIATRLEELLRWKHFGLHLSHAWNVVLAGRPNVGKSSLINALVGYSRSIVYDQPGTTRDVVTAETALDGWPIQLADTAGIREDASSLETAGIELARNRLAEADCRVLLFDVSRPPHADDFQLLSDWPNAIRVAHKCDLEDTWGDQLPTGALWVSSVTGEGVSELAHKLVATVIPAVPKPGTPIPITDRQIQLLEEALQAVHADNEPAFRAALERCLS